MEPLFRNVSDFEHRLDQTFVRLDGETFFCRTWHSASDEILRSFNNPAWTDAAILGERHKFPIILSNPRLETEVKKRLGDVSYLKFYLEELRASEKHDFQIGAQTLGLVNGSQGIFNTYRAPRRQFVLGTPVSSMTVEAVLCSISRNTGGFEIKKTVLNGGVVREILKSSGTFSMFDRVYPQIERVFPRLMKRGISIDTSTSIALSRKVFVSRYLGEDSGNHLIICHVDHGPLWKKGPRDVNFIPCQYEENSLFMRVLSSKSDAFVNQTKNTLEALCRND